MKKCKQQACFEDTTCALGHVDRKKCEHWNAVQSDESAETSAIKTSDIPWNGYSLGLSDLSILAGRGRVSLIGIVGPSDSGKTTLLSFLYMLLLKQGRIQDWKFKGSWTIGGWESIVNSCRWGSVPPCFPPHTTSRGRFPGLLHLTLENESGVVRDVLFSDAPGEWFTEWGKGPSRPAAIGADWVIRNSNSIIFLADTGSLASPDTLPKTRRSIRDLTERLSAISVETPIGFTWSKTDIELRQETQTVIENCRQQFLPESYVWQTTTQTPETITQMFSFAIDLAEKQIESCVLTEPIFSDDPFLVLRESCNVTS